MNILILNGSPRPTGNTIRMAEAFRTGAESAGHHVRLISVCRLDIHDCRACEACHASDSARCIQHDGMDVIYPLLAGTDMLVLASPVYYHGFSGHLKCVIDRFYAALYPKERKPARLTRAALLLASGAPDVYDGARFSYEGDFLGYLGLENLGVFTCAGDRVSPEQLHELRLFGAALPQ